MSPRRFAFVVALLVAVAAAGYAGVTLAPNMGSRSHLTAAPRVEPGYPHLANYNGLRYAWQTPFFADYGLVIARRGAPVYQLKRLNPSVTTLLYERTLQVDLCCVNSLYGMTPAQVPPGWWLVTAGSRLTRAISPRQQWISIADPRPFTRCQDVLVDGESMHVWGVRGHMLHVWRGYYSAARAHRAGARIAPHYSYRGDLSNCRVRGRASSKRPWSFNLSSLCPRWHGMTWADYLARRMIMLVRREGWDGVFYDNMSDFPPSPQADTNGDGRADGGIVHGVNVWRAGERALLAETRRLLPHARLMVNGDLVIDGVAAGREMEGFPVIPGLAVSASIDSYRYDSSHGATLTIVNPDSVDRPFPSMPAMQLAVGASLLGNGYGTYDRGWLDHGFPWWFDEYDGGAGSATVRPLDAAAMIAPVAHPELFHRGDTVLLDWEAARVLRVLHNGLLVQRGVSTTLPSWHPERTTVTTPAQRARGRGYLGQPLGPARLVPTADWSRYPLPLMLRRGPALVDGRRQHAATRAITARTRLSVDATLHYDPMAERVELRMPAARQALRTLVFSARGPAGQEMWIDDGSGGVPLVLRGAWHRYVLPVGGDGRIVLGFGRVAGRVEIKGMRLVGVQAFVLRRDFTRGIVLVNPTDVVQRPRLAHPYRVLSGDQNPWANTGRLARVVPIARYRAVILLTPR